MDEIKSSVSQVCRRVLVLKDSEVVLMFKVIKSLRIFFFDTSCCVRTATDENQKQR